MPRIAWSPLIAALVALPLSSCFHDETDCPTCPPEASSRIEVVVSRGGLVDSVQARVDDGPAVVIRRDTREDRRFVFEGLRAGIRTVTVTRWFFADGLVTSRTSTLQIALERGELRTILFHNDFPLIAAWTPRGGRPVARARDC